ncbi:MAG: hypothetical protein K1X61_02010 [Chitinophagales bacterium]|nr:hypothetical protein [Chitinophagales bacterium]
MRIIIFRHGMAQHGIQWVEALAQFQDGQMEIFMILLRKKINYMLQGLLSQLVVFRQNILLFAIIINGVA